MAFAPFISSAPLVVRRVDPSVLIDAEFPLGEAAAAFKRAREPGTLKILLRPGEGASSSAGSDASPAAAERKGDAKAA